MEPLEYNLLFRWFVGLNVDEPVWVPTVFSKNRDRLLEGDIAQKFFNQILAQAEMAGLTSDEHFSVDATLIEAWASQKSFQRKDQSEQEPPDDPGNPTVNFHGEKRSNQTHESKTDPEARLARKSGGQESKLAYCGNVMIENRNGLVVDTELIQPSGMAERDAAMLMAERIEGAGRATMAADKAYDTKEFVGVLRELKVTPHVAQNEKRPGGSAIDARTTRHSGYQISQRKRKRIEEVFGWMKTVGMAAQNAASGCVQSRMGLHLHGRCLQSCADAKPALCGSSVRISPGISVPERRKTERSGPRIATRGASALRDKPQATLKRKDNCDTTYFFIILLGRN